MTEPELAVKGGDEPHYVYLIITGSAAVIATQRAH